MLSKIISGGQTGADQAGLYIARIFGLKTGGYAPKNFKTQDGNQPELLRDKFDLKETPGGYKERTYLNVKNSDGTIRFAFNFATPGEQCTLNAIMSYNKPYKDIDLNTEPLILFSADHIQQTVNWIRKYNISTLNIAGNSETRSLPNKSVFDFVYAYLGKVCYLICPQTDTIRLE